ncbi:MAG: RNA polymerase sigma factor [Deltaproteobacteria bacterium]|jgi:RNA polymerase sigma-70 factor, ECF subfamily|nr:RNA polymerase sigma factor [Deltaproteobacteria bacterium]MBT4527945.1 RNA polymerase sigma factor [Deltaproteobacteria bacterium]
MRDQFNQFYIQYRDKIFAYLFKLSGNYSLASDLTQETFTKLLEKYDPQIHTSPLLYRIARNVFFDHQKKEKKFDVLEKNPVSNTKSQYETYALKEEVQELMLALKKLNREEREVLLLATSGDLSYSDISEMHQMSVTNVKVKVHRARTKLRKILNKEK